MHAAKAAGAAAVEVWGSGRPRREFLHVDDLADACVHLLEMYNDEVPINVGCGADLTIAELAEQVRAVVGFQGHLCYNTERPDGTPRKLLDVSRLAALGWRPRIRSTRASPPPTAVSRARGPTRPEDADASQSCRALRPGRLITRIHVAAIKAQV
jgi:nucleoside-diphosphate-sugar epimerase